MTRYKGSGLPIPVLILSRVFQETSNGVASQRVAEANTGARNCRRRRRRRPTCSPPPPPQVPSRQHFNAILLLLFNAFCPVVIAAFTRNVWMSVVMSVVASGGFSALWSWRTSWRTRRTPTTCR